MNTLILNLEPTLATRASQTGLVGDSTEPLSQASSHYSTRSKDYEKTEATIEYLLNPATTHETKIYLIANKFITCDFHIANLTKALKT